MTVKFWDTPNITSSFCHCYKCKFEAQKHHVVWEPCHLNSLHSLDPRLPATCSSALWMHPKRAFVFIEFRVTKVEFRVRKTEFRVMRVLWQTVRPREKCLKKRKGSPTLATHGHNFRPPYGHLFLPNWRYSKLGLQISAKPWQIAGWLLIIIGSLLELTCALSNGTIAGPYDHPFPQTGGGSQNLYCTHITAKPQQIPVWQPIWIMDRLQKHLKHL